MLIKIGIVLFAFVVGLVIDALCDNDEAILTFVIPICTIILLLIKNFG